jgi:processing peptidase subunit beta
MLGNLTKSLNQVEVFRARAKIFNKLLEIGPDRRTNEHIAQDLFTKDRRLQRTEMAHRVSQASEQKFLCEFGRNWFFDKDTCLHTYGNAHRIFGADVYGMRHLYATRGDPHVISW